MVGIIDTQRCGCDLDEAFGIIGRPAFLHLAVFAELGLDQIVFRIYADRREGIGTQLQRGNTVHITLALGQHGFDVTHHRFQILALVEEHSVPIGNLIFPVLLPFTECKLLQKTVGTDDQHRRSGFETDTAFDADDGISYVHVTSDAICATDLLHFADGLDLIFELLSVDRTDLALFEADAQLFRTGFLYLLEIGAFGSPFLESRISPPQMEVPQSPTL